MTHAMTEDSRPRAKTRIAAGGTFKWAGEIVAPVIAHFISQGVTDFYLALHADHPGVETELERAFGGRANLTIVRHNNKAFRQAAITNMLLSMAREEGFTVFIPFDADEFYAPADETSTLRDAIEGWVASDNGEQMLVSMPNFLVPRDTEFFRARTLGRMPYRVVVKPGVSKEKLNLRLLPQYKSISRISGIPNARQTFVIGGNHKTLRSGAHLRRFTPSDGGATPIKICHVPFPSRNMTAKPSMAHRAQRAATTVASNQLGSQSAEELRKETWTNCSLTQKQLDGRDLDQPFFTLISDESCLHILNRIIDAGFDVDDPWCRSLDGHNSPNAFVTRHFNNSLLFDAGVSAVHAQVSHVAALYRYLDADSIPKDGQRKRSPMEILSAQARKMNRQETLIRRQPELDATKAPSTPNLLLRFARAIRRRLTRRSRNAG